MRVIKFRAWHAEKGMITEPISMATIIARFIREFRPSPTGFGSRIEEVTENEYTLMQFTGLLDKNGKEIYEGDIVRYVDDIGTSVENSCVEKVYWNEDEAGFYGGVRHETWDGAYIMEADCMEVVGNIYENSDLITK